MNEFKKGPAFFSGPDDGESFWQPKPSTGYITNKVTPANSPYDTFSSGIQVLEPGASVVQHAHRYAHEMIFVYSGVGYIEMDGTRYEVEQDAMLIVGRGLQHLLVNTGDTQMKVLWVMFPPGLENWFEALGRPREPGDPLPDPFDRPTDIQEIQDRMNFVRPGEE